MKKDSFEKKLAGYVAMAAAYLAAHPIDANAQIIYTNVNPDADIFDSHYFLDLNNDGNFDFMITASFHSSYESYMGFDNGYSSTKIKIQASGNNQIISDTALFPLALPSGDTISQNAPWGNDSVMLNHFASFGYDTAPFFNEQTSGNWMGYGEKFLGLKISVGVNTYYGWARFYAYEKGLTLYDYAYISIPNEPILTGQGIVNSINTLVGDTSVFIFPNPVIDKINLQLPNELVNSEIKIFDASGRILLQQKINSTTEQIPLENFSSGIYFFEIRKEELVVREKFLID